MEGPLRQGAGRDWFDDLDDGEARAGAGVERFRVGLQKRQVIRAYPNSFLSSLCTIHLSTDHHVHCFDRCSDVQI